MLSYQGYLPQFTKGFEFPGIRAGKKSRVLIVADDVLSTMPAEGLPAPLSLSGTVYAHTATKDAADDMQNVQRRSRKLKSIVSVLHWASLRRGRAYGLRTVRLICRCTTALSLTVKFRYDLYATLTMWPEELRQDLRDAVKAKHKGDLDTSVRYFYRYDCSSFHVCLFSGDLR